MTTFKTNNPIGSTDPRDLYDNAENLDFAQNGSGASWVDRLGVPRKTFKGIETDFSNFMNSAQTRFDTFIASSGYQQIGEYAAGVEVSEYNQIFRREGEFYKPSAGLDLPYTLTGDWGSESDLFVPIGDAALRQELALSLGSTLIGYVLDGTFKTRTLAEKLGDFVSVKDFGAVGDYATDDTEAIIEAMQYCAERSLTLYFPPGIYRVSQGLRKPKNVRFIGAGKPNFGITVGSDDKRFLRPGHKHLMPGSSIVWSGSQTETITTGRNDRWGQFGFMLATEYFEPNQIQGMGLICDVDCFTEDGALTTPANDNRAQYDVGFVVDSSMNCAMNDFSVFGYFGYKKGTLVLCRDLGLSNPDYNYFFGCDLFGGISIIGYQGTPNAGLSGTMLNGCNTYDATYHNRGATPANDWIGQSAIEIDGQVAAGSLAGVKIIGGCIRTTCPVPLKLDRVQDFSIIGTTMECVLNSAYSGQTLQYITGTQNTGRVLFSGVRNLGTAWAIRLRQFATEILGSLVVDENHLGAGFLFRGGNGVAYGASTELAGDPFIQWARGDFSSNTAGWTHRFLSSGELSVRYNNSTKLIFSDSGPVSAANGVAGKTGASSPTSPALLPWSGDLTSGIYRANSLIGLSINGEPAAVWTPTAHRPGSDNTQSLGLATTGRYTTAYLASNPIVSSDRNLKKIRGELSEKEIRVWDKISASVYQYLDQVQSKGTDSARLHVGFIAQEVRDAFIAEGLDPWRYALLCKDPVLENRKTKETQKIQKTKRVVQTDKIVSLRDGVAVLTDVTKERYEPIFEDLFVYDEQGNQVFLGDEPMTHSVPVMVEVQVEVEVPVEVGFQLSLRYEQCLTAYCAYISYKLIDLQERISEVENRLSGVK